MRRVTQSVLILACVVAMLPSLPAEPATHHERVLERLVATPTPLGPLTVASDEGRWQLDVPAGVFVVIQAEAPPNSPFYLRAHKTGEPEPAVAYPSSQQAWGVSGPASWRVLVDPAGGVGVDIHVSFRGHVAYADGAPAAFSVTDLGVDGGCVVPGACLP